MKMRSHFRFAASFGMSEADCFDAVNEISVKPHYYDGNTESILFIDKICNDIGIGWAQNKWSRRDAL